MELASPEPAWVLKENHRPKAARGDISMHGQHKRDWVRAKPSPYQPAGGHRSGEREIHLKKVKGKVSVQQPAVASERPTRFQTAITRCHAGELETSGGPHLSALCKRRKERDQESWMGIHLLKKSLQLLILLQGMPTTAPSDDRL